MIKFIGFVAQWITRLTTDQEIPGSTPGRLDIMVLKLFCGKLSQQTTETTKTFPSNRI